MEKRSQKRIFAMLLALVLVVSTLSADVLGSVAAEKHNVISFDGADVEPVAEETATLTVSESGTLDGSDNGSLDGSDVSGSDVSGNNLPTQEEAFLVTDSDGEIFGNYDKWDVLLVDFKARGALSKEYIISVLADAVIGKTMPSQAAGITLKTADKEKDILYFAGNTINMTTPLVVEAKALCVVDSDKAVNINTKGKQLTLNDTERLGTVKGTTKGSLVVKGNVDLQGNLQSFKTVEIAGTLHVTGNVSSITNLVLDKGIVYLEAGKNFTVTNVDATAEGTLGFPMNGKLPVAKINGKVSGVLNLKLFEELDGNYAERKFAAGSKLLTASKATVEQFALAGERQVCYKKGSVLYVGAEVLSLYKGDEHLGTYAQWNDLRTRINNLKDKTAEYRVELLDDYVITGTLAMPTKGRYAGLVLQNSKSSQVSLKATGNLTLTADLIVGPGITLEVKQVSGGTWNLKLDEGSVLFATGNITLKDLVLGRAVRVQTGGKLTVKGTMEAVGDNELILTYKKIATIKDTIAAERIMTKLVDKNGNRVTAVQNNTVFNVKGNSYANQYCLLDAREQELPLYRKGNTLRVQGTVATPIELYYVDGAEEISLGAYSTLGDVKTEIGRRKVKQGAYRVHISEKVFVKGALPLPKAGTYESIVFTGERIRTTGNVTLTGNITLHNKLERIKSEQDVTPQSVTINLAKYTLTIPQGNVIENLVSVTGAPGSCLTIDSGVEQTIVGNLKVDTLKLDGVLGVKGTITVTDIYPGADNRLDYELNRNIAVKGHVYGVTHKLMLNPLRDGKQSVYTEDMKVLSNVPKAVVAGLTMEQDTKWVLYRDGNVVRLGKPLLTIYENTEDYESVQSAENTDKVRFARVNDAIEYVNTLDDTDYVIRLDENIPSAGAFKSPAKGKNVVICGAAGEQKTLKLTGTVVVDGGGLHVRNIMLDNGTTAGPSVVLKNGASLGLCDVSINSLTAPAGTSVILEGQIGIKGAFTGACDMTIMQDAVVKVANNLAINSLTLNAAKEGTAQLRIPVSKKITVSGTITTPEEGQFIINRVDAKDALAELSVGTVMLTAPHGQSSQFKTQNIMPGTFLEWSLIKKGDNIQTSETSQGDGEWSGDFL